MKPQRNAGAHHDEEQRNDPAAPPATHGGRLDVYHGLLGWPEPVGDFVVHFVNYPSNCTQEAPAPLPAPAPNVGVKAAA
ncbi:hypothetical protein MPL3365_40007 [Mesorhizobium plurifarium]|uniref:Uncharacterized protein n=1 Tax=Mesorhizobium plurifarium TaxID=69974 RepID=A0A090GA76_MESPL|nr:hypothetical protein MPL3365_40007 [Mesorhizobium plurifarium]